MCKSNMSNIDRTHPSESSSSTPEKSLRVKNVNLDRLKQYQSMRNRRDNVYYLIDFYHDGNHVYSVIPRFLLKGTPRNKPQVHDTIGGCRNSSVVAIIDPQWLKSNESKLPQILSECQRLENVLDKGIVIFQQEES